MASTRMTHRTKMSKAVLERQKSSSQLLATLEAPELAGAPTLLHDLARWLRRSITTLVALDEEVFTLCNQLTQVRQERDTALRTLTHDVAQLRLSIESQYKAPGIERLGFETPTPRSSEPLLRVATRVAKNLTHPELGALLGRPWYQHPFDPTTHHPQITRRIENLRHLLHQVDTLHRQLDQARIRRNQAQKDHDTLTREARQIAESTERLAALAQTHAPPPQELEQVRRAEANTTAPITRPIKRPLKGADPSARGKRSAAPGIRRHQGQRPEVTRYSSVIARPGARANSSSLSRSKAGNLSLVAQGHRRQRPLPDNPELDTSLAGDLEAGRSPIPSPPSEPLELPKAPN